MGFHVLQIGSGNIGCFGLVYQRINIEWNEKSIEKMACQNFIEIFCKLKKTSSLEPLQNIANSVQFLVCEIRDL